MDLSILENDYVLTHTEKESAKIVFENRNVAKLKELGKGLYKMLYENHQWLLNKRVDGEIGPFSVIVFTTDDSNTAQKEVLKIKDHIFLHRKIFYMLGGIPDGGVPKHHLTGSKYICRLANFPFQHPDHVDEETRNRFKRHRGVPVGEFSGLGSRGFQVKLGDELNDIGLQLAASTYLIYSSI